MVQEFLPNPSADLQQHILEQRSIIQAQGDLLEQQRIEIENHHRKLESETDALAGKNPQKRPPGGAFPSAIVKNVVNARSQTAEASQPNVASPFKQSKQEQLVYQFTWEYMDLTLQNESRLSCGDNQAIKWSAMVDMPSQQVKTLLSVDDSVDHPNPLLVSHLNELSQLSSAYSVLEKALNPDRVDILIIMVSDRPLFPTTGPQVESLIPWCCSDISKLSRPLVTCDDAAMHCYVAQSIAASRKNALAPQFQVLKVFAVGVGAQPLDPGFPAAQDNMLVVHAEDKAIPSLFAGMGRKGNKMIAPRNKLVTGCGLIWHSFPPKEISQVLKAYKGYPYFALMSEEEYDGSAFEDCPIVIQLYPKTSHKQAISPFSCGIISTMLLSKVKLLRNPFFLQLSL